jgi:hypothetical protein
LTTGLARLAIIGALGRTMNAVGQCGAARCDQGGDCSWGLQTSQVGPLTLVQLGATFRAGSLQHLDSAHDAPPHCPPCGSPARSSRPCGGPRAVRRLRRDFSRAAPQFARCRFIPMDACHERKRASIIRKFRPHDLISVCSVTPGRRMRHGMGGCIAAGIGSASVIGAGPAHFVNHSGERG